MKTLLHSRRALLLGSLFLGALVVFGAISPATAADKETRQRWILDAKVGPLRTAIVRDAAGRATSGLPGAPYAARGLSLGDSTFFGRRAGSSIAVR